MSVDVVDRAKELWDERRDWPEMLSVLRAEGYSKLDSVKAATLVLRIPLGAAKLLVHLSATWEDSLEQDEQFHQVLEVAASELARGLPPGDSDDEKSDHERPPRPSSNPQSWEIELEAEPTGAMPSEEEVRQRLTRAVGNQVKITDTTVRVNNKTGSLTLVVLAAIILGSLGARYADPEEAAAALRHELGEFGRIVVTIRPAA